MIKRIDPQVYRAIVPAARGVNADETRREWGTDAEYIFHVPRDDTEAVADVVEWLKENTDQLECLLEPQPNGVFVEFKSVSLATLFMLRFC